MRPQIEALVASAIAVEEAGLEVEAAGAPIPVSELQTRLDSDPDLRIAFEALTPGRQREDHLHFSGAKKSEMRAARIERAAPRILEGVACETADRCRAPASFSRRRRGSV